MHIEPVESDDSMDEAFMDGEEEGGAPSPASASLADALGEWSEARAGEAAAARAEPKKAARKLPLGKEEAEAKEQNQKPAEEAAETAKLSLSNDLIFDLA
jgi:hypothetical protein